MRAGASGIWLKENRARHTVNSQGVLDREVALQTDAFRVAVLGDSITEALQVDRSSTFVRHAQSALAMKGQRVEVLNFGLAGATPAVMAARLEGVVSKYSPDLVVLLMPMDALMTPGPGDDSEVADYVVVQGAYERGAGFRETAAYKFRTSRLGTIVYSLIANVRVFSVLNSRKNAGLFADLAPLAPARIEGGAALDKERDDARAGRFKEVWIQKKPASLWDRANAFFADLHRQRETVETSVAVGFLGMRVLDAPSRGHMTASLNTAYDPVDIIDFDDLISRRLPRDVSRARLTGFGAKVGQGHLNDRGHRVYGEALELLIAPYFQRWRESH